MIKRIISIDYETHLISEEFPAPKPVCLTWAEDTSSDILVGMDNMETFMASILTCPTTLIIAHNMKFEMTVTAEWFPSLKEAIWKAYEDKRLVCTMVDEKIINNFANKNTQHRFDLATLVKKYLKKDISAGKKNPDAWRLRYAELEDVPLKEWPQAAIDYAIGDSVYTLDIHHKQDKFKRPLSYNSTRADYVLAMMANRGMEIDPIKAKDLKEELLVNLKPGYVYLKEQGFGSMNPITGKFKKENKLLREFIEENVENIQKTPKGTIKLTSEALNNYRLKEEAEPRAKKIFKELLGLSAYEKILTAFVPRLIEAAEGIHIMRTNYNPVVSTGRTSSSGSKLYPAMNMQQCPRDVKGLKNDVRGCFKARKGYNLVSIDYGGLELAATAHQLNEVYGHSVMKDLLNEGSYPMDLHSKFAAQVMTLQTGKTITYEEFLNRKKEKEFAYYRQVCKALNLGFPGGIGYEVMGTQLFQQGVEIKTHTLKGADGKRIIAHTERQATMFLIKGRKRNPNLRTKRIAKFAWIFILDELVGLKQRYYEMYPEIEVFLKETHNYFLTGDSKVQQNEFEEWEKEPLYRFDSCGMRRDYAMYTQFCNGFLMQSPSAQGAKQMLWEVGHHFRDNEDVHMTAFIHDEIVLEIRDNDQFEANVDKVSHIMITSMQKTLPSVRINVEAAAMKYWSKNGDSGMLENLYWGDPSSDKLNVERGKVK